MAKGLRSKIKKRYRNLRRGYINEIKIKPETQELNTKCQKSLAGLEYREKEKKNAFLHPEDPEAHFPQYKPRPLIDLRSTSIPGSGHEWSGGRRKKQKVVEHLDERNENKKKEDEMSEEDDERIQNGDVMNEERVKNVAKKKKKVSKLKKTFVF